MADKNRARSGLETLCRYGCYTALLPYRWDPSRKQLCPGSRSTLMIFNIHKNATIAYLIYMWFRLVQVYLQGEFSLLSGLWAVSSCSTTAALVTMAFFKEEVMLVANRLLSGSFLGDNMFQQGQQNKQKNREWQVDPEVQRVENEDQKMMSRHMLFNLILLYTNPEVHSLIVYQNPCAINFVSSLFFNCTSSLDQPATLVEQLPFLTLEAYVTCKWQIVCSFMWCCIFLGFAVIGTEVKKLERVTLERSSNDGEWANVLLQIRKCELGVKLINSTFRIYLTVLPAVGVVVVAMLLYGTIRLWRIDPESNVMFPLCAIRCGFEALTPLAMAGTLNDLSDMTLAKWKKLFDRAQRSKDVKRKAVGHGEIREANFVVRSNAGDTKGVENGGGRNMRKLVVAMQKSCKQLQCTSGPLFSFESSIVLVTVDNCIQITVNLLVSFPASV